MTDKQILDFIFDHEKKEFTEDEMDFWEKIDRERRKRKVSWGMNEPYDFMSIGIYIGIKYAEGLKDES